MTSRIKSIFKVDCKEHTGRPIYSCDHMNDLKLLCSACPKSYTDITLEQISKDILTYYNIVRIQKEQGIKQIEAFIKDINIHFKAFLEKIDEDLKIIKKSIKEIQYYDQIEQQWINDTTRAVNLEDIQSLVTIWNGIFYCEDNISKIRDGYKNNIKDMLNKIQTLSDKWIPGPNPPGPIPPGPNPGPNPNPELLTIKIDRLQNLDYQLKPFPKYSVCHFKVLQSCKLKEFLMPPMEEDVTMIFGIHTKINFESSQTQVFDFSKSAVPKFYVFNIDVFLQKEQFYTLSLQLKDQYRNDFKSYQYCQNSNENIYLEFIDDERIYNSWGKSNQFYFNKGLFPSLIIE